MDIQNAIQGFWLSRRRDLRELRYAEFNAAVINLGNFEQNLMLLK